MITRVQFDPNVRIGPKGNDTYAWPTDADGPLAAGDDVILFEPEGEIEVNAKVIRFGINSGLVYFAVDWKSLRKMP